MGEVFISWSGEKSKAIAEALRGWLPNPIQAVKPWMSDADIDKGSRWAKEIAQRLEQSSVGVICLTPDNLSAPWVLFEAGALSKILEGTYVIPYLSGVGFSDVTGPLAQFQAVKADKEGTKGLLQTINKALDSPLPDDARLSDAFEKWWPDLEKELQNLPISGTGPSTQRSDRELLEEMLLLLRRLRMGVAQQGQTVLTPAVLGRLAEQIDPSTEVVVIGSDGQAIIRKLHGTLITGTSSMRGELRAVGNLGTAIATEPVYVPGDDDVT